MPKLKVKDLVSYKQPSKKLCAVTAYDYSMAKALNACQVDMILVGDSLGMVCLGYDNTTQVTMDDMIHHAKAVSRAKPDAILVADMPFLSYHGSLDRTLDNVRRMIQETGVDAVKIEGGKDMAPLIEKLCDSGISVISHIGLLPQSIKRLGQYRVHGKDQREAQVLIEDAQAIEQAGAAAVVLECIKEDAAARITESISIPTIGIGAGKFCDGQILVLHDLLGLSGKGVPKFVKQYANVDVILQEAVGKYCQQVRDGSFPGPENVY